MVGEVFVLENFRRLKRASGSVKLTRVAASICRGAYFTLGRRGAPCVFYGEIDGQGICFWKNSGVLRVLSFLSSVERGRVLCDGGRVRPRAMAGVERTQGGDANDD